jgi:lipoyl(octanoyl) transferase
VRGSLAETPTKNSSEPQTAKSIGLWVDLGGCGYAETFRLQEEVNESCQRGELPATVIVVEHRPCLTLGRASSPAHVLADEGTLVRAGVEVHVSDRGGDVTYHGPGQLVCYPILNLRDYGCDAHAHSARLEEIMIGTAAAFGVDASRRAGYPGVWTRRGKLGSVGVGIRRWVTMHGAALNVCPDLAAFSLIVPCGLANVEVTSLEQLVGEPVDMAQARLALQRSCAEVFGLSFVATTREELTTTMAEAAAC